MTAARLLNKDLVELPNASSEIIDGDQEATQYVNNLMEFTLNEFFIEPDEGVDWLGIVEPKSIIRNKIRNEITGALSNDNRVEEIFFIRVVSVNNVTRATVVSYSIRMDADIFLEKILQIKPAVTETDG